MTVTTHPVVAPVGSPTSPFRRESSDVAGVLLASLLAGGHVQPDGKGGVRVTDRGQELLRDLAPRPEILVTVPARN